MRLVNAARYFDDISMVDPYTGFALPFKSQFSTFEETDPDGSVSRSRSMSIAPGIALPPRRAGTLLGETWIMGDPSQDGIYGKSIRQTVPMRRTTDLFDIMSPGQIIMGATGTQVYGRKDYLKDTVDGTASAEYYPFYNLFFPSVETAPAAKAFFRTPGGTLFRCRSSYTTKDGFICCQCDLADKSAVTWAEFGSSAYDPILDAYAPGMTQYPVLVMLPHQLFVKKSQSDPTYHPGDLTVLVRLADIDVSIGQTINIRVQDLEWVDPSWWSGVTQAQILSASSELDVWNLHIRRA